MKLRVLRRFDFTNEDEWFGLIEFVFQANIVCVCLVYPFWFLSMSNDGFLTDGVIRLVLSSFISGIFLLGITIVQLARKRYRRAVFDLMFAILAVAGVALMVPSAVRSFS